jgi:hypothetical protein
MKRRGSGSRQCLWHLSIPDLFDDGIETQGAWQHQIFIMDAMS